MTGTVLAIVDTGVIYAAVDADDADHERCSIVLDRRDIQLAIPALVVAEVTYLVGARLGAKVEAAFLKGLAQIDVEPPTIEDWDRIAFLVERYGDFPLGGTDASLIALAERLRTDLILTLDRRHFAAVRPRHCKSFRILP